MIAAAIAGFQLRVATPAGFEPDAKIFAPFWYNFLIIEFPIPPEAPVTIIFLPFKSLILLYSQYRLGYL